MGIYEANDSNPPPKGTYTIIEAMMRASPNRKTTKQNKDFYIIIINLKNIKKNIKKSEKLKI